MQNTENPEIQENVSSVSFKQPANQLEIHEQTFRQLKISRNRGYQIVPLKAMDLSDLSQENDLIQDNLTISVSCLAPPKEAKQSTSKLCCVVLKLMAHCFGKRSMNGVKQDPSSKYIIKDKETDNCH